MYQANTKISRMYVCMSVGREGMAPMVFSSLSICDLESLHNNSKIGINWDLFFFDLVHSVRLEFGEGKTWATLYLPFMGLETGVIFVIQKLSNVCIVIEVNYL